MSDTSPIEHPNWLTSGDFAEAPEPFRLFGEWLAEAEKSEPVNPNAMALATVDASGLPDVRMVLLKGFDVAGFVFYSNRNSAKGQELAGNPKASLAFYWKTLARQVRVRGTVTQVSDQESDDYFATRPRGAQLGAWASQQSSALESRFAFEKAIAVATAKYPLGKVPRPPYWIGYRVAPLAIEFWHERAFRLHDRIAFTRESLGAAWVKTGLYP
ncbi:MAG: pyridoxamine 5'-phosphate oxidase [Xanthobacteraceae bacterium]